MENRICNRNVNFLPVFLNSSRTEIVKSFSNCITHVVIDLRIVILTAPRISDKIHLVKANCQGNVNKSFSPTEIRLILPNCLRDVEFLLSRVYLRLRLVMEVFSSMKLLLNPSNLPPSDHDKIKSCNTTVDIAMMTVDSAIMTRAEVAAWEARADVLYHFYAYHYFESVGAICFFSSDRVC